MCFYLLLQPGSEDMWMLKLHEGRVAQILLLSYPSECYYTKYSKEKHSVQGRAHFLRIALLRGLVGYEIRRIWSQEDGPSSCRCWALGSPSCICCFMACNWDSTFC